MTTIITVLATLLAVFIVQALTPNNTTQLLGKIRDNQERISVIEAQYESIKQDLKEIKQILMRRENEYVSERNK